METYKGRRPLQNQEQRLNLLDSLPFVKRSFYSGSDGGKKLIGCVNPDLIVIGSDWHESGYLAQLGISQEQLDKHNIGVVYLPRTPGVSSTVIRERLS